MEQYYENMKKSVKIARNNAAATFEASPGTALPDRTASAVYIFSGSFGWKSKTIKAYNANKFA